MAIILSSTSASTPLRYGDGSDGNVVIKSGYTITMKQLYATAEEEEPYETDKRGGFITFSEDSETKKLKGRTSRKLITFKIPPDKIMPEKKYDLKVKIEGSDKRGRTSTYRFELKGLYELINK